MKQLIISNFKNYVFENYSNKQKSSCCGAEILEDGTCSECGAYETFENDINEESSLETQTSSKLPSEVVDIAKTLVGGFFVRYVFRDADPGKIAVKATDNDFKYAPEVMSLRDLGFESWSSKPYDIKLTLSDSDPDSNILTYDVEYAEKEAKRVKHQEKEIDDFEDSWETHDSNEFDFPEKEPDSSDISDEDDIFEKKVSGGFSKLKIKRAPKNSNPNNKFRKNKGNVLKPIEFTKLMTENKDQNLLSDKDLQTIIDEAEIPPIDVDFSDKDEYNNIHITEEGQTFIVGNFSVSYSVEISGHETIDSGDYWTPPSSYADYDYDIYDIYIYNEDDDEDYKLTPEQTEKLSNFIKDNINIR
ncbi:MAG: hypothetical protein WC123_03645 [Bacilli bacterium]